MEKSVRRRGGNAQGRGEQSYQLLCNEYEPDRVAHFSHWKSIAAARAFFESARLVEIRQQAGVEASSFNYLHMLEEGMV
jgi:heme-degrading monooxygenase HmoA